MEKLFESKSVIASTTAILAADAQILFTWALFSSVRTNIIREKV